MQDKIITIDQLRKETLLKALNRSGSIAGAARLMGISERTLWRWKLSYRIQKDPATGSYFVAAAGKIKTVSALPFYVLASISLLVSCCPARDTQGNYWKPWDVPHRMFAHKSHLSNHQSSCPSKP